MIVSAVDSSLILGVTEGKISALNDSSFVKGEPTIHAGTMMDGSFVQITETCIIHVRSHVGAANTKWQSDPGRKIVAACSNSRQIVIQVEKDQLVYFEIDSNGKLIDKGQKIFKQEIKCIDIGEVPEGRLRFKFLMAGFSGPLVRVLSLEPESCFNSVST
jgi:splicing factor 3B subunit 3